MGLREGLHELLSEPNTAATLVVSALSQLTQLSVLQTGEGLPSEGIDHPGDQAKTSRGHRGTVSTRKAGPPALLTGCPPSPLGLFFH